MKLPLSLLLVTAICSLPGAVRSASARESLIIRPIGPKRHKVWDSQPNMPPILLRLAGSFCSLSGQVQSLFPNSKNVPILKPLDQPPGDESQADDDSSSDTDPALSFSEQCHRPAEWRLIRPDAQLSNSFIHSKSKPPP